MTDPAGLDGLRDALHGLVRYTAGIDHGPCVDAAAMDEGLDRLSDGPAQDRAWLDASPSAERSRPMADTGAGMRQAFEHGHFGRIVADLDAIDRAARVLHERKGGGPFDVEGDCECRDDAEAMLNAARLSVADGPGPEERL